MAMTLNHLAVKTHNVEGLAKFYTDILDLKETRRHNDEHGLRSIWLKIGTSILMVERSRSTITQDGKKLTPFSDDPPGYHLIAFTIDEDEKNLWRQRLSSEKIRIENESEYTIYFRDPEGNRIGLSSFPAEDTTN